MSLEMDKITKRAVVNKGNFSRLIRVMEKAKRGETVYIGAIGGSITEGALATKQENRYLNRIGEWFKSFFDTEVIIVNAGIGATNAMYALHRLDRDFLCHPIDIAIVDFCCNDFYEDAYAKNEYEMLVRKILKHESNPAVILFSFMERDGNSRRDLHFPTGFFYDLPILSYHSALWPEIEEKRLKWEEISPDEVHPNDFGHYLAAEIMIHYIKMVLNSDDYEKCYELPAESLYGFMYENAHLLPPHALTPKELGGFKVELSPKGCPCYSAVKRNEPIIFEIECENIGISFIRWNDGTFGVADVQIDDGEIIKLNGHFPEHWEGFLCSKMLAAGLAPGKHSVSLTLTNDLPENSTGERFMFCFLLVSGKNITL